MKNKFPSSSEWMNDWRVPLSLQLLYQQLKYFDHSATCYPIYEKITSFYCAFYVCVCIVVCAINRAKQYDQRPGKF